MSFVGIEVRDPAEIQIQLNDTALKKELKNTNFMELVTLLLQSKEKDAIEFLKNYKPSNVFNFRDGEQGSNIFQIAVEKNLLAFLKFLLVDYKVTSCLARATRNVNQSIVINNN